MDDNDKLQFAEIMYGIADNFGAELSKPGLKMRFEALKAFDVDDIQCAAIQIISTRKYKSMPTIADFLEYLNPKTDTKDKAQIEADKIIGHLRNYGATSVPVFDDDITRHLMTSRWHYQRWAREVLESELKWWVKEFVEAYNSYALVGGAPLQVESSGVAALIENIGSN